MIEEFKYLKRNLENKGITPLDVGHYIGSCFEGYLTFILTSSPSLVEEANWFYFLDFLKENKIDFKILKYGHWLIGNYQRIGIYPSSYHYKANEKPNSNTNEKLKLIDDLLENLKESDILDTDFYYEFVSDKFCEHMETFGYSYLKEKLNLNCSIEHLKEVWDEWAFTESDWEYETGYSADDFTINIDDFEKYIKKFKDEKNEFSIDLFYTQLNEDQYCLPLE